MTLRFGSTCEFLYTDEDCIGYGAFGRVYQARITERGNFRGSDVVAVKVVHVPEESQALQNAGKWKKYLERLRKLLDLQHIHLLPYHKVSVADTFHGKVIKFVMDYCNGRDLALFLKDLKEKNGVLEYPAVMRYALQMTDGLQFLHENHIIHGDLKPANMLLQCQNGGQHTLLIGDLDDFVQMHNPVTTARDITHYRGTVRYMSPEMLQKCLSESDEVIGRKTDVWSLGCIIAELVNYSSGIFNNSLHDWLSGEFFHVQHDTPNHIFAEKIKDGFAPYVDKLKGREVSACIEPCFFMPVERRTSANELLQKMQKFETNAPHGHLTECAATPSSGQEVVIQESVNVCGDHSATPLRTPQPPFPGNDVDKPSNMGEEFAVGIDLGTSSSCVVVYRNDRVEIIAEPSMGARAIPSCIAFDQTGPSTELLFGIPAKNHQKNDPHHCIYNVRRIIGKRFDDKDVQLENGIVPYKIINEDGYPRIRVKEKGNFVDYAPEEISSMVLSYLKRTAEDHLGYEVKSAVITVPANFDDAQRKATKLAAEMAGLRVLRLLNEPTAAAMAYAADLQGRQNLLVFDFGHGTLDISILEVQDGKNFRIKSTAGSMRLGGDDIDRRMVDYMLEVIREKHNFDASRDHKIKSRLLCECKELKRQLSQSTQKRITIPNLLGTACFTTNFTRAELERLYADLFEKILEPVDEALRMAQMTKIDISHVISIGASSHIPKVRELLGNYFPNAQLRKSIEPSEAVAKGAALLAASIGMYGANPGIRPEDVTPWTLGINVFGGDMSQLIPKGSSLPIENRQIYTTFKDNQTYIDIDVFEGEHQKSKQNHYLGSFKFSGIRPAPKGKPNILISFCVDLNGILMVTASQGMNKMSMVFGERKEQSMAIGSSPPNNTSTAQARSRLQREVESAKRDVAHYQDKFGQIRLDLLAQWLDATKDQVCPLRQYERWSSILQSILSDH